MLKGKYIYCWYEYKWPPVRYDNVEALATQVLRHFYYYYYYLSQPHHVTASHPLQVITTRGREGGRKEHSAIKNAAWNSFGYICTRALHSFRSFTHCRAASTVNSYGSYTNQIDKCKTVDSFNHTTINMANLMYIIFFPMWVSACGCVRQYEHHSTLPHLLPFMYDFMTDKFASSLDISHVHTM